MGWTSSLEDAVQRHDEILNRVEGLYNESRGLDPTIWRELDQLRQSLSEARKEIDRLLEIATNPETAPKLDACEVQEILDQVIAEKQKIQEELKKAEDYNLELIEENEGLQSHVSEMARFLQAEQDINQNLTAKFHEEEKLRQEAEDRIQKIEQNSSKETVYSNQKNYSKRR